MTQTEFVVGAVEEQRFLALSRIYATRTRREPDNLACELMRRVGVPRTYVLHEAFRNREAHLSHLRQPYTDAYAQEVARCTAATPRSEHFDGLLGLAVPPPLPRPVRPSLEAAVHALPELDLPVLPRLRVALDRLELSTATDGPFRGRPDPCLLFGVYRLDEDQASAWSIGRGLLRLTMADDPPCVVESGRMVVEARLSTSNPSGRILLLAVAIEENTGRGVQRTYQELDRVDSLLVWKSELEEPAPDGLFSVASSASPGLPQRVQVLVHGEPLCDSLHDDTWVGASLCVLELPGPHAEAAPRLRFDANPVENDWVATLRVSRNG